MEQNKLKSIQGSLSPLLRDLGGLKDHPSEDTGAKKPSRAPVGASEARGRSSKDKKPDQKKVTKTLESWVQGPSNGTERLTMKTKSLNKRALEDTQPRKGGLKDIRSWFERQGLAQEEGKGRKDLKPEPVEEPSVREPTGEKPG